MLVPLFTKKTFRSGFTTQIFKEVQCTEYRVQAKQNWTILEKLGLFVYTVCIIKNKFFYTVLLLFNFLFFIYILRESMCTVWMYCMNPTSSWNQGFVRWVGWISINGYWVGWPRQFLTLFLSWRFKIIV